MIAAIGIDERERFYTDFYVRERPVVLRGFRCETIDASAVLSRVATEGRRRLLWREATPRALQTACAPPPLVAETLARDAVSQRARVWSHGRGHVTPWHYDGNGLHGFNLQLRGRKRWWLAPPDETWPCLPFSNVVMVSGFHAAAIELELCEGDLLFVPRYWFHRVESLDSVNLNVNWVMTPRHRPVDSRTARREAQLAWIRGARRRAPLRSTAWRVLQELAVLPAAAVSLLRVVARLLQSCGFAR